MCGIVGLHVKNPELYPRLGELLAPMLDCMSSRGPDSAGVALHREPDGRSRFSLRGDGGVDWDAVGRGIEADLGTGVDVEQYAGAATLVTAAHEDDVLRVLGEAVPDVAIVGYGRTMEVVKDIGLPRDICERYGIAARSGFQGIGHTRMATESAVTTAHSHPFAPRADLAVVHNGSFSNPATVRRRLEHHGIRCETDNDTEVAARYLGLQMAGGADLADGLRMVLKELDGFFTLLVTTDTQFAVMRDSFACKPAVVAETADYVAVASEYHALADLPGVADAEVFEPVPEEVYTWTR